MALETNELFDSASQSNDGRLIPRGNMVLTLTAYDPSSGDDILLPVGTPLSYDASTNKYVVWDTGLRVDAILIVEKQSSATDDVQVVAMVEGEAHFDALHVPTENGSSSANLKTVLYDVATRSQLLRIKGLPGVQH